MKQKKKTTGDSIKAKGRFRLNIINPDGSIAGDSGWRDNTVVNLGFSQYLCEGLGGSGSAKTVTHLALGTGTAPGTTATSLPGEINHGLNRAAISTSITSSKTLVCTGSFQSNAYITDTVTLQNIGLFNTSTRTTGTIFAGNTYTTSSCASNQAVNMTYEIRFS